MDKITFEDELKREGFTQVENCIIRSPKLSPVAKTLYFQLCSYAWNGSGYPGRETLALQNNVHVNTIDKYMNELKESKLIVVKRRGFNKTNVYTIKKITKPLHKWLSPIHRMESHTDVSPISRESHVHVSQESHTDVNQEPHVHVKEEYEVKEDLVKKDTVKKIRQQVDYDSDFKEFYSAYPRKKDKGKALKAYEALRKKNVNPEVILNAARQYAFEVESEGTIPKYIKLPATWLNAESYLDYEEQESSNLFGGLTEEEIEKQREESRRDRGLL